MASAKKIGFFWGEEKVTLVEFDKNAPLQVVSSSLSSKANTASPFSSNLTEEIQITAILQKMLEDNHMTDGSFYVSLPMKEIILRSFIIPFVKQDEIQNAIKFESKKYMPFDIQDMAFVFHTIPFSEGQTKRYQVIFFAVRKEVLARYDRIFKQVNAEVAYCEPYMVSLAKALLFQKEIKPTDHLAFLMLDKNLGRICFIDKGVPQFIREFPIRSPSQPEDVVESQEALSLKIINEVGNSFDFYARQFNGERIEQMLVSSDFIQKDLLDTLETELKVKLTKYSSTITTGTLNNNNDMDAVYAMGACVAPPMDSLANFNFLGTKRTKPKFKGDLISPLKLYIEIVFVFLVCMVVLVGSYVFFQVQLKAAQKQYDQLLAQEGAFSNEPIESIQTESQGNSDLLAKYKSIRMKSDVAAIILKIASHLPTGAMLSELTITYNGDNGTNNTNLSIDMHGTVYKEDPNEQIGVAEQVFSDIKNDKELSQFVSKVSLVSLNREDEAGRQVTGFNIHCS